MPILQFIAQILTHACIPLSVCDTLRNYRWGRPHNGVLSSLSLIPFEEERCNDGLCKTLAHAPGTNEQIG